MAELYATYEIISFFLFPRTILWFDKLHYLDSVTSSFINRNSYATYAGIGLTAALAVTASQYLHRGGLQTAGVGRKMVQLVALTIGPGGLWIACASIVAVALILTGSRGGFFATLGGSLTFLLLAGVRGRKNAVALGFGLLIGRAGDRSRLFQLWRFSRRSTDNAGSCFGRSPGGLWLDMGFDRRRAAARLRRWNFSRDFPDVSRQIHRFHQLLGQGA